MLPFPIISNTNIIPTGITTRVGYNFSTSSTYGVVNVAPNPVITPTALPVTSSDYSNMVQITNTSVIMNSSASALTQIGTRDFELHFVFYLFSGTSYDVLMTFKDVYSGNGTSMIDVQVNDGGLNDRLGVVVGNPSNINDNYLFNITRSQMTNTLNNFVLKRTNGILTATMNGNELLIGLYTNPSINTSLPSTQNVLSNYLSVGENNGGTLWGVNVGVCDMSLKIKN